MDQYPDWVSMINLNLSDHEARLQMLESAISAVDLDDDDHGWAGDTLRQVQQYDLRTSSDRQAARMDNHDQRLRAIEHRLLLMEVDAREKAEMMVQRMDQLERDLVRSIELTGQFGEYLSELRNAIKGAGSL